jgi:hypothetical protein
MGPTDSTIIGAPPLFIDANNGDFRLQPGSPCIDAGSNAVLEDIDIPSFDIAGTKRPLVLGVDMGAYEMPDTDGDNLLDLLEEMTGTDPGDADTDDDGIIDGDEDYNLNGIRDADETDPRYPDTDSDGIQDGTELGYTLEDIGPDTDLSVFQPDLYPYQTTDPLEKDTDGDDIPDGDEDANHDGAVDAGETNPGYGDTDNDGMPDGWEALEATCLSPFLYEADGDSDSDGFLNYLEYRFDGDPCDITVTPVFSPGLYFEYNAAGRIRRVTVVQ